MCLDGLISIIMMLIIVNENVMGRSICETLNKLVMPYNDFLIMTIPVLALLMNNYQAEQATLLINFV